MNNVIQIILAFIVVFLLIGIPMYIIGYKKPFLVECHICGKRKPKFMIKTYEITMGCNYGEFYNATCKKCSKKEVINNGF